MSIPFSDDVDTTLTLDSCRYLLAGCELLSASEKLKDKMASRARLRSEALWVCSRCGRQFAKAKQAHSCRVYTIDDHFHGKDPKLRSLLDALLHALERRGPLRVDAVESTINLVSNYHFGGIAVRRGYLRVGFILDRELRSKRIARSERVGAHRVSHHVYVRSLRDLDAQLLDWLAAAQAMQARRVTPAD